MLPAPLVGLAFQRSAPPQQARQGVYDDGRWWNGDDRIKDHRKNTESAGYKTRDLYTAPQPAVPTSKDSDDFFTNDNPKLKGLNEPVKVPSDIWRGGMTTEQERAAFKSWYANSHNSGTPWDAWKARAALAETAPCLFKALQKIASLPEYRMDEASLIATEALYEVERAALVRYGQSAPKFGEEE